MQIISSQKFLFEQHAYSKHPANKENPVTSKVIDSILVKADVHPQIVPDWVAKEDLFHMGVEDGKIKVVEVSAPVTAKAKAPKVEQPVTKVAEVVTPIGVAANWPNAEGMLKR
jgi:hypothetical protein